jgi:hypothetical protein
MEKKDGKIMVFLDLNQDNCVFGRKTLVCIDFNAIK